MDALSHDDQLRMAVISGDLEAAKQVGNKVLRVFISSTFNDTQAERNYLMREVYPKIRLFCEEQGLQFNIVDFRWGIRDHATINHKSTEICLNEIDRCFRESIPGPSFVILSFNRYGWTPLPRIVKATEFESILSVVPNEEDKAFVLEFYKKDENAVPPEYVLQPICKHMDEFASVKETWHQNESRLQKILQCHALNHDQLSREQQVKWRVSVTENEVRHAIHKQKNTSNRAFAMIREIRSLTELSLQAKTVNDFYDASQEPIEELRTMLGQSLVDQKVFDVEWKSEGISEATHADYIENFGQEFEQTMQSMIIKAIEQVPKLDELSSEVAHHSIFCAKRGKAFYGRSALVEDGIRYFKNVNGGVCPFIIHGISGAGKTSFMSRLALKAKEYIAGKSKLSPVLAIRFCGTTPNSSNARALMSSITKQIRIAYKGESSSQVSKSYAEQIKAFKDCLRFATKARPLLVLIDSLDQLSDDDQGRSNLRWVSENLPPNVYLVLSTLPDIGGCYKDLKRRAIPDKNYLEVKLLSDDDSSVILRSWLNLAHRTLTDQQYNDVLSLAKDQSSEKPTSLRLRLLYDVAVKCASYDQLENMPNTVGKLIERFLQELEKEHGKVFVSTMFGLMGASKLGLSENDLLDVMSCQEDVLFEVLKYHQPSVRRIPQVVFARIRNDLGEYVVDRGSYDKPVLAWYHRQFWEAANTRYLKGGCEKYAEMIRAYFSSELHDQYPERKISSQPYYWKDQTTGSIRFNMHKLGQLPSVILLLKSVEHAEKVLCDFQFIAASLEAGLGRDLVRILKDALDDLDSPKLTQVSNFLSSQIHLLDRHPSFFLQEALNFEAHSFVHEEAVRSLATVGSYQLVVASHDMKVLCHVNKSTAKDPCIMTLTENTEQVKQLILWGEDYLISACESKQIILWSLETGKLLKTIDFPDEIDDMLDITTSVNKNGVEESGVSTAVATEIACACMNGKIYFYRFTLQDKRVDVHLKCVLEAHVPPFNRIRIAFDKVQKKYFASCVCYVMKSYKLGEFHVWDMSEYCAGVTQAPLSLKVRTIDEMEEKYSQVGSFKGATKTLTFVNQGSYLLIAQESHLLVCSTDDLVPKRILEISLPDITAIEVHELDNKASLVVSNGSLLEYYTLVIGQKEVRILMGLSYGNKYSSLHLAAEKGTIHIKGDKAEIYEKFDLDLYFRRGFCWRNKHNRMSTDMELKMIGLLVGHSCSISACAASDKWVSTGSTDGIIKIWDLESVQYQDISEFHQGAITSCHLQPEDNIELKTVTTDQNGTEKIWYSETGKMIESKEGRTIMSRDKSVTCRYLGGSDVCFEGTEENSEKQQLNLPVLALDQMGFSSDGEMLFGIEQKSVTILIFKLDKKGFYKFPFQSLPVKITEAIGALFFPNAQKMLVWGSCKHFKKGVSTVVYVVDFEEAKYLPKNRYLDVRLRKMGFVQGKYENKHLQLTPELLKIEAVHTLEDPARIECAEFLSGATRAAFGLDSGSLQIRDLQTFKPLVKTAAHEESILCMSSTEDGRYLVTGSDDGWVKVWKTSDLGKVASVFSGANVTSVVIFKGSTGNLFINFGDSKGDFCVFEALDSNSEGSNEEKVSS